mmetsp:Transcript_36254/g.71349  ORF Transcript_36254/g.71349 Transcript_36254/m.71349 type:complete len:1034 (+) Transcript_36254:110-3211(+)
MRQKFASKYLYTKTIKPCRIQRFFLFALSFLLQQRIAAENINLIFNRAPLLSGGLDKCPTPLAETCTGGVATAWAYARHYTNTTGESVLYIANCDRTSPFVQMHPLGWNVNHLVLNGHFGHRVFVAAPSLLTSPRDISSLRSNQMPLLVSDVLVPPSSQWYGYTRIVYFDPETHLAVVYFQTSATNSWPKIEVAKNALDRIAEANEGMDEISRWIPLIFLDSYDSDELKQWNQFLSVLSDYHYPPAIILKTAGEVIDAFNPPKKVTDNTWVASFDTSQKQSHRIRITLGLDNTVQNITLNVDDLTKLPSEMKDSKYVDDQIYLNMLASEATSSDPVVGRSKAMPLTRIENTRMCFAGECIIGNLFTDAIRWKIGAEIAFLPSGGLRGPGWPAGEVRMSDIWAALPFANTLCSCTLSGFTIFKILNFSTSVASFTSTYSKMGDRLMQVSGLRYTYNTKLKESRLITVEVWDENSGQYLPLERLRLYSVVTDNFLCSIFNPFPNFFGSDIIEGEVPGAITDTLVQYVIEEYLTQLGTPYNTTAQGRLLNNTSAQFPLNFIQSPDKCPSASFWSEPTQACLSCPVKSANKYLTFSEDIMKLEAQKGQHTTGRVVLSNRNIFDANILIKSNPEWVQFTKSTAPGILEGIKYTLHAGESIAFDLLINTMHLEAGVAQGPISFIVMDTNKTGAICAHSSTEIAFDLFVRVVPPPQNNYLSNHIRGVGLAVMGMIILSSLAFAVWVIYCRENQVIKSSQPLFLLLICCGTLVMSTAIIPLSIDDKLASVQGCNIACMAVPWLLSVGFVLTFSALFSKILRINTVVQASLRLQRIKLSLLDVLKPLIALSMINLVLLLIWTIVDPLKWVRIAAEETNKSWNTYGACRSKGKASYIFITLIMLINFGSLVMTCVQAYQARFIRDGISESKYIGIAACSWLEVFIIAVPLLFLVQGNSSAAYFLLLAIICVMCMSMLLLIFVPKIMMMRDSKSEEQDLSKGSIFREGTKLHQQSSQYRSTQPQRAGSNQIRTGNETIGIQNKS